MTKKPMPAQTQWLRSLATSSGAKVGVDREQNAILGYVVAQEGVFKDRRGAFDMKSLRMIRDMMASEPKGLKSRFTHPDISGDGLGKFLGRVKNPRLDKILKPLDGPNQPGLSDNAYREINVVRADLYLDPTCFDTPNGNLGDYVMRLAESDSDALSSSLVLRPDEEAQLDDRGKPLVDETGQPLPTLWRPLEIHASDVVDIGDAVDGFLSIDGLPDAIVRKGTKLLDEQFGGQARDVIRERCLAYLDRYLDHKFGPKPIVLTKEQHDELTKRGSYLDPCVAPWSPEEKLAGYGGLTIGDMVQFWDEDSDDELPCACREYGIVKAVSTSGPLDIPGTSCTLEGTVEDPAALVLCVESDGSDYDDGECYYLVPFSKLEKVVMPREEPTAGSTPIGYMAAEADVDENLLLEIEMRTREGL
jgi:hypothetical protein